MNPSSKGKKGSDKWKDDYTSANFVHKTAVSKNRLEMVILKRRFMPLLRQYGHAGLDSTRTDSFQCYFCVSKLIQTFQTSWV